MIKKVLFVMAAINFIVGVSYADVIKGAIEKVDIKIYEIIVDGNRVDVSTAIVFTDNDMGVIKPVIIRDLKDHKNEKAICYGSVGKDNIFHAYRVRVVEGHR